LISVAVTVTTSPFFSVVAEADSATEAVSVLQASVGVGLDVKVGVGISTLVTVGVVVLVGLLIGVTILVRLSTSQI
jgi:hypothetical protein